MSRQERFAVRKAAKAVFNNEFFHCGAALMHAGLGRELVDNFMWIGNYECEFFAVNNTRDERQLARALALLLFAELKKEEMP